MKSIKQRFWLSFFVPVIGLGALNISLTEATIKTSDNGKSIQLLNYPVPCLQRTDVYEFEEDGCYHSIIRADCWSGGWDFPCFAGIQYIVDCPDEDPVSVGEFTAAESCKEPS